MAKPFEGLGPETRKMRRDRSHRFRRRGAQRRVNRVFLLAVEGEKIEVEYFAVVNRLFKNVHISCLACRGKTEPRQIDRRIDDYCKRSTAVAPDETWIIVDTDQNADAKLRQLVTLFDESRAGGVAVSNPKFEYWLLLHFEDGN